LSPAEFDKSLRGTAGNPKAFDGEVQGDPDLFDDPEVAADERYLRIAHEYIDCLTGRDIDALVLGCTHYPLLGSLIQAAAGSDVVLVSAAAETAKEVQYLLKKLYLQAPVTQAPVLAVITTGDDVDRFAKLGSAILSRPIQNVSHLELSAISNC
ncbi:MAG: hypothetical protein LUB61_01470, partial [Eggerthellaceae bacterium]|nr:hypothetical protein [Eggerthellaceae bacterium]